MKTILKNIMLFAAGALTLGFTACEEDGQDLNFKIQPGNELYAPADNASVNLDQGLNTSSNGHLPLPKTADTSLTKCCSTKRTAISRHRLPLRTAR